MKNKDLLIGLCCSFLVSFCRQRSRQCRDGLGAAPGEVLDPGKPLCKAGRWIAPAVTTIGSPLHAKSLLPLFALLSLLFVPR